MHYFQLIKVFFSRLSYAINIACMQFGLERESSNGCVGIWEKTYPLSLDDFNELCTAVIVKKKNWHAKCLYATHLTAPTWLKWFNILKNLVLSVYLKKKGFCGLLSTWRPLFIFLWKKGFLCAYLYDNWTRLSFPYHCEVDKMAFYF